MKNAIIRSLSLAIAIILATMLSVAALADGSSMDTSDIPTDVSSDSSSEATSDTSSDVSDDASSDAVSDTSSNASSDASSEATSSTTSNSTNNSKPTNTTTAPQESNIPWAKIITLAVIVVLILALIILSKTDSALGQRIAKFFKEYLSEIKKIAWSSPKDTAKATGVVLVFIVGAGIVIGLLDYGFTQLIKLLADIF